MLNIGKLRVGGESYYLNSVARGVEEYYTHSGESPGYWTSSGTKALKLQRRVDEIQLRRILDARDPHTGNDLLAQRSDRRVPGFDLTFRVPKSVSLLHALGSREASNEVVNAHDSAVAAAMTYMESVASHVLRSTVSPARPWMLGPALVPPAVGPSGRRPRRRRSIRSQVSPPERQERLRERSEWWRR